MPPRKQEPVFGIYIGEVVFDEDPKGLGRVRVLVPELSGEIPLPWAVPLGSSGGGVGRGFFNPPAKKDSVAIAFQAGDFNRPMYWTGGWADPKGVSDAPTFVQGQEDKSPLKRGLETRRWRIDLDDEPAATGGSFAIRDKDTGARIIISQDGAVLISDPENRAILISPSADFIQITDQTNKIEIQGSKIIIESGTIEIGEGATEKVVLGDTFKAYLDLHTHKDVTTGAGVTGPPVLPMPANTLSGTAKVID